MVVIINSTTIMDHTKFKQNSHFQKMIPVELAELPYTKYRYAQEGMLKCLINY